MFWSDCALCSGRCRLTIATAALPEGVSAVYEKIYILVKYFKKIIKWKYSVFNNELV